VLLARDPSPDSPSFLSFPQRSVPLQGDHRLTLSVLHRYAVRDDTGSRGARLVRSRAYWYHIAERDGPELIAFHWHPGSHGQVPYAHLHVEGGPGNVAISRKRHVPTGRVSLEAVVRFAIEELGVQPIRPDWREILDQGIELFDAGRSW
jgi:hypothetical protein